MGRNLFSSQGCASLGKLKFHQHCVFRKTWVEKGSLLTKENHLRLKNIFIREYTWNLSFTIHVLLKL